ncbi:MAG: hypothetical protein WD767_10625 [Alphaproteobacteria bacterium]
MTEETKPESTPTRKSGEEARQGRPGRPVLAVLIAGTVLGLVALLVVYLLVDNPV